MKKVSFTNNLEEYRSLNFKIMLLPTIPNITLYIFIFLLFGLIFMILLSLFPWFTFYTHVSPSINFFNIIFDLFLELFFIVTFIAAFVIRRYKTITKIFNENLKDREYVISANDDYIGTEIGDLLSNKYAWERINSIREFAGYYLVATKLNKNQFAFFPKSAKGAEDLAEFIKSKINKEKK